MAGKVAKKKGPRMNGMAKYKVPALLWLVFEAVAIVLWRTTGNLFYLGNFSYIGTALAAGTALYIANWRYARHAVQFAIGTYMLVYLGFLCHENMQIEGFWYYLFLGSFEAATIHYAVAKIFGPRVFGRGWCGYACWTAMVLDLLPYKVPATHERRSFGWLRYVTFVASLAFVGALFLLGVPNLADVMWIAFIVGNAIYYVVGIALAFALKDNRAFCKYICPVTVFLKPMSKRAVVRVTCDKDKCISCGKCRKICPMDVDVTDNSLDRRNGTECILCMECTKACPKKAL